ncbi:ankyrin repeat-containing domain protein [Aspergillus insuetus]
MALANLPVELVRLVVSQACPPDNWGKYWPFVTRSVDDVRDFLALRLVCKDFNNIVLDYFLDESVLLEDLHSACLQHSDPPTPRAVRFCRRLLTRHLQRSRAAPRGNEVSRAFSAGVTKVVDAAVDALKDGGGGESEERLRDTYTEGMAAAVIGFEGTTKALLQGVAGKEPEVEGEEGEEGGEETEGNGEQMDEDDDDTDYTWTDPLTMALTAAAILCRVDDMKTLIKKGANAEHEEEDGWLGLPLHGAAMGGNLDAIRLIQEHTISDHPGIKIDCLHTGNTALHFAAQYGHAEAVQFFLDSDIEPDERNKNAQTPLFLAAGTGHVEALNKLLDLDYKRAEEKIWEPGASRLSDEEYPSMQDPIVDVDADDYRGRTPMCIAVQRGYYNIVERLMLRAELDINRRNTEEYGMTYLMIAASKGNQEIFDHLLGHPTIKKRIKDSSGHSTLKHAAVGGNENIVREVLSWVDAVNLPGADDSTPIMWAAIRGHESIVQLLIDHGAAVDRVTSQLHLKMMSFLGVLGEPNGDTNANVNDIDDQLIGAVTGQIAVLVGASALDAVAHGGHVGTMRLLMAQPGVEIDRPDRDGRTPLANAALTGHKGIVKLLLAEGDKVNPEAPDKDGCTPLILAARAGDASVVRVLMEEARVDSSRTDKKGLSALTHAAEKGHEGVVKILLAAGRLRKEIEDALEAAQTPKIQALLTLYLQKMPEEEKK